jgi:hypothetical protein
LLLPFKVYVIVASIWLIYSVSKAHSEHVVLAGLSAYLLIFYPMDDIYEKYDKMYDTEEGRAEIRQWLAQLSDKELDEVCRGGKRYLLDAIREREYKWSKRLVETSKELARTNEELVITNRKLVRFSERLDRLTIWLLILTLALLVLTVFESFSVKFFSHSVVREGLNQNESRYQEKKRFDDPKNFPRSTFANHNN